MELKQQIKRRREIILFLFTVGCSVILGIIGAIAFPDSAVVTAQSPANVYELGKEEYLKNCSGCHIPIPPEVLPTETWREILEKPQRHYGQSLKPKIGLTTQLIWQYLSTFSRPLLEDEPKPEYVTNSRYFKALHPGVDLPKPVTHQSCVVCHPGAKELDYRRLSSDWEN